MKQISAESGLSAFGRPWRRAMARTSRLACSPTGNRVRESSGWPRVYSTYDWSFPGSAARVLPHEAIDDAGGELPLEVQHVVRHAQPVAGGAGVVRILHGAAAAA